MSTVSCWRTSLFYSFQDAIVMERKIYFYKDYNKTFFSYFKHVQ